MLRCKERSQSCRNISNVQRKTENRDEERGLHSKNYQKKKKNTDASAAAANEDKEKLFQIIIITIKSH